MTSRIVPNLRGRTLGTVLLVVSQVAIGIVHSVFGLIALLSRISIYNLYTFAFGLLVLLFSYGLWMDTIFGRIGTVAVSVFVAAADMLAILNLPSIPDIPKFAAYFETIYSLTVIVYLLQTIKLRPENNPNKQPGTIKN